MWQAITPNVNNALFRVPAASSAPGRIYYLRNIGGANAAVLESAGGNFFNGDALTSTTTLSMPATGNNKTVQIISDGVNWTVGTYSNLNAASTAAKNFIYMPSIAIDVSANVTGATKNLYSLYSAQFTTPKAASTGAPAAIPVLPAATDFYYYVTYADPAVFTGAMTIDASGVLTYNVTASAVTDATFINIVLVPKN